MDSGIGIGFNYANMYMIWQESFTLKNFTSTMSYTFETCMLIGVQDK